MHTFALPAASPLHPLCTHLPYLQPAPMHSLALFAASRLLPPSCTSPTCSLPPPHICTRLPCLQPAPSFPHACTCPTCSQPPPHPMHSLALPAACPLPPTLPAAGPLLTLCTHLPYLQLPPCICPPLAHSPHQSASRLHSNKHTPGSTPTPPAMPPKPFLPSLPCMHKCTCSYSQPHVARQAPCAATAMSHDGRVG